MSTFHGYFINIFIGVGAVAGQEITDDVVTYRKLACDFVGRIKIF